ncbi:TonB-dependent receptor [Chitinophaga sp. S165]|uniref:TonB-dependent receptor n=1 Tax=Chitinophaga sp. S165 TaxID=2135462 RepID=UPI000D958050|nr:TonB-dependent receptor [Chitinophaga sp. S165]PWV46539.1 TonB-linked SusC/RagA family outer membrane protein [Chitinophaga sp. S165]
MKLTTLLIILTTLQVSATTFAQKVTLSEKNTSLEKVFDKISTQTGYDFLFTRKTMQNTRPVNIQVNNEDLAVVLQKIFDDQPLKYNLEDQSIVVTRKAPFTAPAEINASLFSDVSGKVTDEKGNALIGATIRLKGTSNGTAANTDGGFIIKNVSEGDVLVISYAGFVTREIKITGESSLSIVLKVDQQKLGEFVVVGYGTVQRKDLTGAVSSISPKDIDNMPVTRVDQMLQGRAAGVDVKSTNGAPGAGTTIRVRGSRSITATNEPLYVIDGLIDAANLNTINPEDIASIDILKDASATAIYGSRAANGVVLITTKKGVPNQDKTNLSVITGVQKLPKTLDLMNARQFAEFINESRKDQNRAPVYTNIDSAIAIVGEQGTNWTDATTRAAVYQSYNLSTSGGSDKMTYFISGNVINQQGIVIGTGFKKYQGRVNLNKKFSDRVNMGLTLNGSHYRIDDGNVNYGANSGWVGSMITLPPTMPVYKADGTFVSYNPIWYSGGDIDTPPAVAALTENYNTVNDLQANLFLQAEVVKGLKLKSAVGTSLSNNKSVYFVPSYMPNKVATGNTTANASSQMGTSTYVLNENTATYDRNFGDHHINVLGGFTYEHRENNWMNISVTGLTDDIMKYNNFGASIQANRGVNSDAGENTRLSYLGRINYDFKERYYLTLTGRSDGASNFAANHKWGFFPSLGLKWRASSEPFFQKLAIHNVVNDLAFRFSVGRSGNQGIGNYQSLATLAPNAGSYVFGSSPAPVLGFTQSLLSNPDLTWETSSQIDIGADVVLFDGRLNLDANYYKTKTRDLLLSVQIPQQTGFSQRLVNLGKTESKGFEFLISGDIIKTKNFNWRSTLTISTNEQKVLDVGPLVMVSIDNNGYGANTNYLKVGVPIGANFGATYGGVWHNQEEIDAELAKAKGERTLVSPSGFYKPGKPRYADQNGDGLLNIDDYVYLGTPNPKLFGGFGNTFTYRDLSLDIFFQYNQGNTMYNYIEFFMGSGAEYTNQFAYMANRWTPSNPTSDIPAVNSRDNVPSSRFLHDASLIRLKSLQLSYNLQRFLPKAIKSASIYFTGTNLFLTTKYNGFDPEVNKEGTSSTVRAKDDGTYPNARTYAFGINVGF